MEEVKKEEIKPETTKNFEDLVKSRLEESKKIAERLEHANAEAVELMTRTILGGKSSSVPPPVVKEETPKEYKDRIMRGGI